MSYEKYNLLTVVYKLCMVSYPHFLFLFPHLSCYSHTGFVSNTQRPSLPHGLSLATFSARNTLSSDLHMAVSSENHRGPY